MRLDPREIHDVEQTAARLREMAANVAAYKQELMDGGVPEVEAWASAQKIEERWAEIIFSEYEKGRDARALETVMQALKAEIQRRLDEFESQNTTEER